MLITNNQGTLSRKTGQNAYSENIYAVGVVVQCAVVSLTRGAERTIARHDQSASRGAAEQEYMPSAKILFPASVTIDIGDKFEIAGAPALKVTRVQPRFEVIGGLDHYEVSFELFVA